MKSASEALALLQEGNRRFVANEPRVAASFDPARRAQLVGGQEPFAVILGCSDSRVPAELVFDRGVGDLFVIRVAGNIVAPSLVGSVEFAAANFGTRLVVVLGHTQCGAIAATLEAIREEASAPSKNLLSILKRVRPAVETVLSTGGNDSDEVVLREAMRANVRASTEHLRHGSDLLDELGRDDGLLVVGAEYSLETGVVTFFDGV